MMSRHMSEPTCTILLVDDDAGVSDALSDLLISEGYRVAVAGNGAEALRYLDTHPLPSAILLDLMMPVMDGYEFRAKQRRNPVLASVPTFAVSAGAMGERVEQMALRGAFKKPIAIEALLDALQEVCQGATVASCSSAAAE